MSEAQKSKGNPGPKWEWGKDEGSCINAARYAIDPKQLKAMAKDILTGRILDDGVIAEELLNNRSLPFSVAVSLAEPFGSDFAPELCCHPDATPEILDKFYNHFSLEVIDAIVNHPNTKFETLNKVLGSEEPFRKARALASRRFPENILKSYATNEALGVRSIVAKVTEDASLLRTMAGDQAPVVRCEVAKNSATPIDVVEGLARQNDSREAKLAAARRTSDAGLYWQLAESMTVVKDADLANAIIHNPNFGDTARLSPEERQTANAAKSRTLLLT